RGYLFRTRELDRLAGVLALGGDDLLGARLHRVGELEQRALPLARRRVAPRLECGRGRTVGGVDVGSTGQRRRAEHLTRSGIDEVGAAAVRGLDLLAVDEVRDSALLAHAGAPE